MIKDFFMSQAQQKSGLKTLEAGEILFNEGEIANSMYIIQKGQIRLYRPKGNGFVEIGVLRAGEVLGEMAFFDPDSKARSASASAITKTEIIEISFVALDKTMTGLSPWFKTIVQTIVNRLKKSNEKVKMLESNNVGYSSEYKFLHLTDIVKVLSMLYLSFRSFAEKTDEGYQLDHGKFKNYAYDVFSMNEAKVEEFLNLMHEESFLRLEVNEADSTKKYVIDDPEKIKFYQAFFHTQKALRDDKKIQINSKCEKMIAHVILRHKNDERTEGKTLVNFSEIIKEMNAHGAKFTIDDFQGAKNAGFCGEYSFKESGEIVGLVNFDFMERLYPAVRLMIAFNRLNESKAKI